MFCEGKVKADSHKECFTLCSLLRVSPDRIGMHKTMHPVTCVSFCNSLPSCLLQKHRNHYFASEDNPLRVQLCLHTPLTVSTGHPAHLDQVPGGRGGRLVTAAVVTPSLEIGVPSQVHQLLMMWQSQTLPSLRPHCLIQKIQGFGPHNLLAIIF